MRITIEIIFLMIVHTVVKELQKKSRNAGIVADATYAIICQPSSSFKGLHLIDRDVLVKQGINDLTNYSITKGCKDLIADLYIDQTTAEKYPVPDMNIVFKKIPKSKV